MKTVTLTAIALTFASGAAFADSFTVSNTFQDAGMTEGQEVPTTMFDAEVFADQSAEIGDGVELENFIGFYSIDFAADMSSLTMTVTETAMPSDNPLPADRFDRYYFSFDGAAPTGATIDSGASTPALAGGAAASVADGVLVVEFGESTDVTPGNTLVISLD